MDKQYLDKIVRTFYSENFEYIGFEYIESLKKY